MNPQVQKDPIGCIMVEKMEGNMTRLAIPPQSSMEKMAIFLRILSRSCLLASFARLLTACKIEVSLSCQGSCLSSKVS